MKKMYSKTILAIIFTICISFAKAQFTGSFAVANWGTVQILCDGTVDISNAPTTVTLISGNDYSGNTGTIDFTITIPTGGNISFDWIYSTIDGAQYDYPGYVINGVEYPFSGYDDQGGQDQFGSEFCIHLNQGDEFAFRMTTADNDYGAAMLEISNFAFSPDLIITPANVNVCGGTPITFSVNGTPGTYTWTGGISTGVPFDAPTSTTSYSIISSNNCIAASIEVTIQPSPDLAISDAPLDPVCAGAALILTGSGATTYTWSAGNVNTASVSVNPTTATTYTLSGTVGTCTAQLLQSVDVIPSPVLILVAAGNVCIGSNAVISVTGADTYTWNTLAQTSSISVSPLITTVYSVIGSFTNGCSSSTEHTLIVNALPTVSITLSRTVVCQGESITLTGTGATTYSWNTTATSAAISIIPTSAVSNYSVTGTDANGCKDTETLLLIANPCVGIETINGDSQVVNFYPNPSNGLFSIQSSKQLSAIQITDINGKIVFLADLNESNPAINVEQLSNGIYFVKTIFADGNSQDFNKLIINK